MSYLALIGTVTLVHLLAAISPGPDFVMAVKNSLTYSRRTGVWTAVGFALGVSVHVFYCVAGLAVLISESIMVFNVIKLLGAGYLLYIGINSWLARPEKKEIKKQEKKQEISALAAVRMGFLTNILNPKATLFFLSLFTLVVAPDTPKYILAILAAIMIVDTALWFSLVAVFFTQKRVRRTFNKFQGVFNKVFGTLLVALGIKVALSSR